MRWPTSVALLALSAFGAARYLAPAGVLTDAHAVNVLHALLPIAAHPWLAAPGGGGFIWRGAPAAPMPDLLRAPWPGAWPLPELRAPDAAAIRAADGPVNGAVPGRAHAGRAGTATGAGPAEPPALLMLHVFSRSDAAAARRRALFRARSPLATIPPAYRHLVEFKFILGRPLESLPAGTRAALDAAIDNEAARHGDVVRLDGLVGGDNLNEGRTFAWLEWVARRPRAAWWVVKCDDDSLPLLPNLLPYLLEQDPQVPTYFGNPLCHPGDRTYFADGAMYGMSWGIVKTIGAANLSTAEKTTWEAEDFKVGRAMNASHTFCAPGAAGVPGAVRTAPDARSGLVRLNLARFIGEFERPWIRGWRSAMAWHHLKDERAWDYAVDGWASVGRRFEWVPPTSMAHLAATE